MRSLTPEENELLVRTDQGTPMGEVFRRSWIPATLSSRLADPDGDPIRLQLLGERLVAFRDTRGRIGLMGEFCPHRQTSLALARNEDCGLRCIYHGWKLDVDGNVLETPPEPPNSKFARSIKHKAYPTREAGGLVWTYMGDPDRIPPFPNFAWLDLPGDQVWPNHFRQQCNYLQGLDGDVDAAHAAYLHASAAETERQKDAPIAYRFLYGPRPGIGVAEAPWGLKIGMSWEQKDPSEMLYWVTPFVPPMFRMFRLGDEYGFDGGLFHAWVPIDDENHWVYSVIFNFSGPITPELKAALDESQGYTHFDPENEFRAKDWTGTGYAQDRAAMRRGESFSGIERIQMQDLAIQHSMGPIADRSMENLATEDNAVRELRQYLLRLAERARDDVSTNGPSADADLSAIDSRWVYGSSGLGLEEVMNNTELVGDVREAV